MWWKLKPQCKMQRKWLHFSTIRAYVLASWMRWRRQRNCHSESSRKRFDIRFREHTFTLLGAILGSLEAPLWYFADKNDEHVQKRKGFLAVWTKRDFLRGCCVLRYALFIFSRFQKKIQADSLVLSNIAGEVVLLRACLQRLLDTELGPTGGKEEEIFTEMVAVEEAVTPKWKWRGFEFSQKTGRGRRANLYVPEVRDFAAVQTETVTSLINFLDERMALDNDLHPVLRPLTKFCAEEPSATPSALHAVLVPDLPLEVFAESYRELARLHPEAGARQALLMCVGHPEWTVLCTALARLIAATPHSYDVERLISKYNLMKDPLRSCLEDETLRNYLYVNFNMPVLAEFDVRPAVEMWLKSADRRPGLSAPTTGADYYKNVFDSES